MKEKEKEQPPKPNQLDVARLLESNEIKDWIHGSEKAARYVITVARQHDPHLRLVLERLEALYRDVAEIAAEEGPLLLAEVEQDLERCLADGPESFRRLSLDLVQNWSSGRLEWKPAILLRLAQGRLERGEGDAEKLAWVVEEATTLVVRAQECIADEQRMHAWQCELQERFEREGAAA